MMIALRMYLLGGLLLHKAVWEVMKRGRKPQSTDTRTKLVKLVKVGILASIVLQTLLPDILPIAADSSAIRIAGVCIYSLGLLTAILGRVHLGNNWSDIETAKVLTKQEVVNRGVYRYIRHPIYSGDLALLTGLELALNSWLVLGAILLIPIVARQAIREEEMLREELSGYPSYCERTKRFVPFVV